MGQRPRRDGRPPLRVTTPPPRLHAITNSNVLALPDLCERAQSIGRSPLVALHARARDLPGRKLAGLAELMQRAARAAQARVFVNDRADVALLVEAHGIHLPADGLSVSQVRSLVGPGMWIGRSAHDADEAVRAADDGADYVFLGPIWETPSHPGHPGIGVQTIERTQPARIIAIGGVTADRVEQCVTAGAYGVAAISALWQADDPGSVAAAMLLLLEKG